MPKKTKVKSVFFSIRKFLPSIFTIAGLCFGLSSVKNALLGKYELAMGLIFITFVLDFTDGALARALKSDSEFGAILDSLCDMVTFGICSPAIIYIWGTNGNKFGWFTFLFFSSSMAVRLARFNSLDSKKVESKNGKSSNTSQMFFRGIPAPAGAMLNLIPICLSIVFYNFTNKALVDASIQISLLVSAGLLSTMPTFSLKGVRLTKNNIFLFILLANAMVALFVFNITIGILFLSFLYIATIPFSVKLYKRRVKNTEFNF
ncbi:MAG: CDP-alcohol phosphatidyltransferase family protein [Alphaproteobacteria bacterium]|nr:CDP-alcohol phosphatidyltransferase family protein [Rickettsiales bacterium]